MILLHRPFFQMFHRGVPDIDREAGSQAMHVEACRSSAEWISNILRIYKANYTLVSTGLEMLRNKLTRSHIL